MIRSILAATALAASVVATPALAQTPTDQSQDKVVVEGRKLDDAVRDFVAAIGVAPTDSNLARWEHTVCVGSYNITPDYAQKLIDRVSLVAIAVGLEPGEPGCTPNVLIMASDDGDALAGRLVADHLAKFRPVQTTGTNLGSKALQTFQTSDAPVRWWHVTQSVMTDTGLPYARGDSVRVRGSGRLQSNVHQEMSYALIILDTNKIGSISFASLSDYVAMVALAQLEADADTREYPSILNLFTNMTNERAVRMTQWDLDYLVALHETPGDAPSANREANRIARKMLTQPSASTE